jgi:hypothetical protein
MLEYVSLTPAIFGGVAVSTTTDAAVAAVSSASTTGKIFGGGIIFNPTGSPAGQFSEDGFNQDIRSIPAGPSIVIRPAGLGSSSGLFVRRISGGSNLAGVVATLW